MHCTSKTLLTGAFSSALHRSSTSPPSFLIPSWTALQSSSFSTSTSYAARKDHNPSRSVSALRHTGLGKRQRLSVAPQTTRKSNSPPPSLPQPILDPQKRSTLSTDEDHGLWDFFNKDRESLMTPLELSAHGRGWRVQDLRGKDWEDLHRLWWVCLKEMNRLKTFMREKERGGSMYGEFEATGRMRAIHKTQVSIKHVLTERWYAWENARVAAMEDEEVNLYANPDQGEKAYTPRPRELRQPVGAEEGRQGGEGGLEEGMVPPPAGGARLSEVRV